MRSGACAYKLAGVACVIRVVVTMPTLLPRRFAISPIDCTGYWRASSQLRRLASGPMPMTPALVFVPLKIAVAVPAESGTCWLVL